MVVFLFVISSVSKEFSKKLHSVSVKLEVRKSICPDLYVGWRSKNQSTLLDLHMFGTFVVPGRFLSFFRSSGYIITAIDVYIISS